MSSNLSTIKDSVRNRWIKQNPSHPVAVSWRVRSDFNYRKKSCIVCGVEMEIRTNNVKYCLFCALERRRSRKMSDRRKSLFRSDESWSRVKKIFMNTCPSCKLSEPEVRLEIDHIRPLSRGGSDDLDNIQVLCGRCNMRKFTKDIDFRTKKQRDAVLKVKTTSTRTI